MLNSEWKLSILSEIPEWFLEKIKEICPNVKDGRYVSQILWQRGIKTEEELINFLNPDVYKPTSPFQFGEEMTWAIKRFQKAIETQEKIAIWGDFDADGVTSTSVLWEGLGEFFTQNINLIYYIPNRFTESHGLNYQGIKKLFDEGVNLIVTCDTGSTNLTEIDYANQLGIDLIITDHHTLPDKRPPVKSIINPRYFPANHPLFNLSGVAVAYKLIEALYQTFPQIPQQSLEELLDLVAIGLIADLVKLTGDCRYLAQQGIKKLEYTKRPGIRKLLEFCKRSGDRPTDISFGIGPRINAVSRIHGNAKFCVDLLTSKDEKLCDKLASQAESANTRRKELHKNVLKEAQKQIEKIDLSTTCIIILENNQWESGVLGLVANSIAQEYGRPTIILTTENNNNNQQQLARGSARSINNIDLYDLVSSQANLLHRFGGHPYAAGLSIPIDNIPFFREAINQQLRRKFDINSLKPIIEVDLIVTVAELGIDLFKELKLLEPCGIGNPVPKLLIKNCWFDNIWNKNQKDNKGKEVKYIKTNFKIYDDSNNVGFNGVWWGHYKDELIPQEKYDVILELDYNAYDKEYEVRLIDVQLISEISVNNEDLSESNMLKENLIFSGSPNNLSPEEIWHKLVGVIKYLLRTNKTVSLSQLCEYFNIGDRTLELGLETLEKLGITYQYEEEKMHFSKVKINSDERALLTSINNFMEAINEEKFKREYFSKHLKPAN